ncbi:hypothetical protein BFW87_28525 [Pseudomonas fluorescens]|uniref:Uncharacterized protein n=1 Tax=Pseudomonas fluorescens TaxID=294 RepID=A0A1T2XXX7_PSEFL|nr:hypothetical protein BFW87_28525 [Pseudomonas fluorescens]
MIVPTLCVGMPPGTLRVPLQSSDAERHGMHSHAERGNDRFCSTNDSPQRQLQKQGNIDEQQDCQPRRNNR